MSTNPFASPKQIPTKSYASSIFRLFSGTDLQRTYNGIRTEVEGKKTISIFFSLEKTFLREFHVVTRSLGLIWD